ncbi:sugar lactone lactonase YvrE [Rhizobium leguminosarum]|uniref:SMP-30/gluconolactonase/LRE family protein n=1 Tax=Rhizobium leguminosarum TaxID=384 RepID=UPI0024B361EC|nr:SMP-30/gluconolactonase/LRE family protein [Rhizobium leguminosarum]WHO82632.1 SMP-30/gluconolactonase/LRE family protein [Rhizobium leguminosarum]
MRGKSPKLFADGFTFLEAPKWRDGHLWLSDVLDHKVYSLTADGKPSNCLEIPNRPAGLNFLSDGTLIMVSAKDRKLLQFDGSSISEYADLSGSTEWWLNDFAVDPLDRIYIGDFGYDLFGNEPSRVTRLHRVDPDASVTAVADELDFPNGSVVINGGRTLIVAETWKARISAFDIDAQGNLGNRRLFADLKGRQPDGICADESGAIWAGIFNTGEFVRVLDGGAVTDSFKFNGSAISCTLGGESGRRLFMTAFLGTNAEMAEGRRKSAVFYADL